MKKVGDTNVQPKVDIDLAQAIIKQMEYEISLEHYKANPIGTYNASELGKCPRALQYQALGHKAEPFIPETILIFRDGDIHHHAVRELIAKTGSVTCSELRVQKTYQHAGLQFTVVGRIDGVWKKKILYDIKSMSTYRFRALNKKYPGEFQDYIWQVIIYLDMLEMEKGALIFKDKNTAEIRIEYINYDPEILTKVLDRIAMVHAGVMEGKFINRPYDMNSWHCTGCQYRMPCWKKPMQAKRWPKKRRTPEVDLSRALRASLRVIARDR